RGVQRLADLKNWKAHFGTVYRTGRGQGAVWRSISRIIVHPAFNQHTLDYDVALLAVNTSISFSSLVQPVSCLPSEAHVFSDGIKCSISGWGSTKEGGKYQEWSLSWLLHKAEVELIPGHLCQLLYTDHFTPRMLCAGHLAGKVDTASQDTL
uniref:Peptidase S1 domain-containing protein n=1 Tax=Callorhinchus milii TaxID=7868 RepID=A0A4W3HAS1_CALMI